MIGISHPYRDPTRRVPKATKHSTTVGGGAFDRPLRSWGKVGPSGSIVLGNAFHTLSGLVDDKRDDRIRRGVRFIPPNTDPKDALGIEIAKRVGPPQARLVKRRTLPNIALRIAKGLIYVKPTPPRPVRVLYTQLTHCKEALPGRCFRCNQPLPDDGSYEARHYGLFCTEKCAEEANPYADVQPRVFTRRIFIST